MRWAMSWVMVQSTIGGVPNRVNSPRLIVRRLIQPYIFVAERDRYDCYLARLLGTDETENCLFGAGYGRLSDFSWAGKVSTRPLLFGCLLVGTGLTTCGSSVLNHYLERDVDGLMQRTRNRPLADWARQAGYSSVDGVCAGVERRVLPAFYRWVVDGVFGASLCVSLRGGVHSDEAAKLAQYLAGGRARCPAARRGLDRGDRRD